MTLVKSMMASLLSVGIGILPLCPKANAEEVGTSQADLPNLVAKFYIDNQTDKPVSFNVKWGKNSAGKNYTLAPHTARSFYHPLTGPNRAPRPYVTIGDDVYEPEFGRVGWDGMTGGEVDYSVHYAWKHSNKDGHLDLFKQKM